MIENTLAALKKLSETPQTVYIGDGEFDKREITLKSPISQQELDTLCKTFPFPLPEDYVKFLKLCNGCSFWDMEFDLYSLADSIQMSGLFECADGILQIGRFFETVVYINCNELEPEPDCRYPRYMYAGDEICLDEAFQLNTDFAGFLETLLYCNGFFYWEFACRGECIYYDFRKPEEG